MKKFLGFLLGIILIFLILTYVSIASTEENFKNSEIIDQLVNTSNKYKMGDTVTVVPSTLYKANFIKRLMQGNNYRDAWSTPVKVPVIFLDSLYGGMEIVKKGGGMQTESLRLKSNNGTLYTIRSINKNPEPLIPEIAYKLHLENIVIDGVSAQHPYGALLAAALADMVNVENTHPKIIYVPNQASLQQYNEAFGNRLYLLEYETEGKTNWTKFEGVEEIVDTKELQELKLKLGSDLQIDEAALVRARLLDVLIGDWDRHAKQWGWILQKKGTQLTAIPIAGDRDNAFFNPNGLIPEIITNKYIQPLIRPFEDDIDYIEGLIYPFDTYFLANTSEKVFIEQAKFIQQQLTDTAIDNAMESWPKPASDLNGHKIAKNLKQRRDDLVDYAKRFKQLLGTKKFKKSMKGSEDLKLNKALLKCFTCNDKA